MHKYLFTISQYYQYPAIYKEIIIVYTELLIKDPTIYGITARCKKDLN
jgi:hypothetical protein